jgi:LTXXQ motif family protein
VARPRAVNRSLAVRGAIFGGGLVCGAVLAALIAVDGGLGPSAVPSHASPHAATPPAAASASTASRSAPATLSPEALAAVDKRINELESRFAITAAQQPLWSAFADAMRANAATTDALFAQRAGAVASMSAVENMRSYAAIARAYAENTEHLAAAFDSLYANLSETQKRAADTLFREQAQAAAKPEPAH